MLTFALSRSKVLYSPKINTINRSNIRHESNGHSTCEWINTTHSGRLGVITLNRPKALNALNLDMVRALFRIYHNWESDPSVRAIVLRSDSRAFCAGGDVRAMCEAGKGSPLGPEYFADEYRLNHFIHTLKRPHIAFVDGIVMGGGSGISVHGRFVIATEKTVFAMPETKIGFVPDVGSSYFLPSLGGSLGTFLAMTGTSLYAQDVKKAGLATHYIRSENIPQLQYALENLVSNGYSDYDQTIRLFEDAKPVLPDGYVSVLEENRAIIRSCFSKNSVIGIVQALEKDGSPMAKDIIKVLRSASPLSIHLSHELVKRGAKLSLAQCLQMEYNTVLHVLQHRDFYNGVHSVLIDKNHVPPKWDPPNLEDVTPDMVCSYFKPFSGVSPLELDLSRKVGDYS